jgi:general secretion pathway protein G
LLAALVGPRLFGKVGGAKQSAAKAQIEMFGTALDTFRLDVGRYPTMEEGLKALREKPSGVEGWQGPYLPKEIPVDPWRKPYVYKCPGEHGDYDLLSYGLDGTEGGEGENQDIVSWKDIAK